MTTAFFTLGLKFFAEFLKGAGVITMGGATAAGMALDAALAGAVTFAIGFTAEAFLQSGQRMSPQDIGRTFRKNLEKGRGKVPGDA
jgi:hypothetical protein